MIVKAHLHDTKTGARKVVEMGYPDDYDPHELRFQWTEGNYECDCNRSLFLYDHDRSRELTCNLSGPNRIVLEKLEADGKEIELT